MDPIGWAVGVASTFIAWLHGVGYGFGILLIPLGLLAAVSLWFARRA